MLGLWWGARIQHAVTPSPHIQELTGEGGPCRLVGSELHPWHHWDCIPAPDSPTGIKSLADVASGLWFHQPLPI